MTSTKAGGRKFPRLGRGTNNPAYDIDAPVRAILHGMMDLLGETSPLPEAVVLSAGRPAGGMVTSYVTKTQKGVLAKPDRALAEKEIRERQLVWLEKLGGCTRADGMVYAAADTIHIPRVNGEQILDETRSYTAGQDRRDRNERAGRLELIEAWNGVLFQGATRRKVGDEFWTREKILAAIDEARGPLDDNAVLLIASSMSKIGYDPAYPILVWVNARGERYIVDGRHRDEAVEERGLRSEIVEVHRTYSDVETMLAAIIRAEETRRGFDPEVAADRWAAIGIDLGELRLRAGTDPGIADLIRKQKRADERATQRKRKRAGVARPPGHQRPSAHAELAREIVARRRAGEQVVVSHEAKARGIAPSTLADAVTRESGKPDTGGVSGSPEPPPPAPPVATTAAVATHTCGICELTGQANIEGWCRLFQYGAEEIRIDRRGGRLIPFLTSPFLDGVFHKTCVTKLSWSDYVSLFRGL